MRKQLIDAIIREMVLVDGAFDCWQGCRAGIREPWRGRVHVVNAGSDTVTVLDRSGTPVVPGIPVAQQPEGSAASPDDSFVYVTNTAVGLMSIIDAGTGNVVTTIPIGSEPEGLAVTS
jgi:YVTN family beta-propeller protein